jgi:purine-nucleoside phosphorylase
VFGVRVLGRLGVRALVLTNAAGGIDAAYGQGALVLVSDHINLQGSSPLAGPNEDELGLRFPDLTDAYDPAFRGLAREAAARLGIELHEGVYAAFLGPAYETPAEVRFARAVGANLVGMSTVPEVLAARHMGIRCLALSCVTNMAAGLAPGKIDHVEVLEVGERVRGTFTALLRELLPLLARS